MANPVEMFNVTVQLAKHLRDVHFGGNWTMVNLKETLKDVTWKQATAQVSSFNTIVRLAYHIHYFTEALLCVLKEEPLTSHDKYSFDHPPVRSEEDWKKLLEKIWSDAEDVCRLLEQLPDSRLSENFTDEKYGNYLRNILGTIEHTHYHLGQIVLIKKWHSQNTL